MILADIDKEKLRNLARIRSETLMFMNQVAHIFFSQLIDPQIIIPTVMSASSFFLYYFSFIPYSFFIYFFKLIQFIIKYSQFFDLYLYLHYCPFLISICRGIEMTFIAYSHSLLTPPITNQSKSSLRKKYKILSTPTKFLSN